LGRPKGAAGGLAVCGMRATAEAWFALIYKGHLEENTLPICWSKTSWEWS